MINRIQKPVESFFHQREKRHDAILAYFLIEKTPASTLSQSKLSELLTPKSKGLLADPVCQLVSELRKHFNCNTQIHRDLQPNLIPETQILKQGIREACRGWAQTVKQQPYPTMNPLPPSSINTTSPINSILPTTSNHFNDQEQPPAVVRAPTMVDRMQRFIGHEFVIAHPRHASIAPGKPHEPQEASAANGSAVRRRMTVQNTRANVNNKEVIIEMSNEANEPSSAPERRRASSFLGKLSSLHFNTSFFFRGRFLHILFFSPLITRSHARQKSAR